ncbi:MAG: GNAT family N-acetyltransferase, partial [Chitinophagales bacterium]
MSPQNISIRQEMPQDHKVVEALIETAFQKEIYSDQTEHVLVGRLRQSPAFVPALSIVAVVGKRIVGYILMT